MTRTLLSKNIQRSLTRIFIPVMLIFLFAAAQSDAQILDTAFSGKINNTGIVYATAAQADGKMLIGGDFTFAGGEAHSRIFRINADGTIDSGFTASADNSVYSIVVQADGKILIGGTFTEVNGIARGRVALLNSDGTLDTTFDTSVGASSGIIYNIARQSDGKVIIGGSFTNVNGTAATNRIARLNADGTLDATFNVGTAASSTVYDVQLQADGKILLSGAFTTFNGVASARVARLNADGTVDATFTPGTGASSTVYTLGLQTDGKIVIGGAFTTYNGTARARIARINANGTLDAAFDPGTGAATGIVYDLAIESDGDVAFGGTFLIFNGATRERIARVNSAGVLDTGFTTSAENQVRSVRLEADGKIVIGGGFVRINNISKAGTARLNTDGTLDETFSANVFDSATVRVIVEQPDGKILVGGIFDFANFAPRQGIARFNADGTSDTTFNSSGVGADSTVYAIAVQSDGKIVIGGTFDGYNGIAQPTIARLNADGSLDAAFNTAISSTSTVFTTAALPDGKILVGGTFTTVNATPINRIARLNSDGTLDATFTVGTGASSTIQDLKVAADGKIYIGGSFTTFNGSQRGRIARLNADGTLDIAFDPGAGASSTVQTIAIQQDGRVLIGGAFTTVKTEPRVRVARLSLDGGVDSTFNPGLGADSTVNSIKIQPDGKVLLVGTFDVVGGVTRNRIARLNSNGTLDTTFDPAAGFDGTAYELTRQSNGKYLVGGLFSSYRGVATPAIARIIVASGRTRADFDGDGRTDLSVFRPSEGNWYLDRSTDGFTVVNWGLSTDVLTPEDFDGDGKTDIAVWRPGAPETAAFYIINSSDSTVRIEAFGQTGDVPIAGDFDGDGKADLAVYRDSAEGSQSLFYYRGSQNNPDGNTTYLPWGITGDRPLRGDFDGDGKQDLVVFRPSNGVWYIAQSSDGQARYQQWGLASDRFVPADYDGDGKTDFAVFRDGLWLILQSSDSQPRYDQFGLATDVPVPGDYDGDGKTDVAIYRGGVWYINQSTSGVTIANFGLASDVAVPSVYNP